MKTLTAWMAILAVSFASTARAEFTQESQASASYVHNRRDYWLLRDRFPDLLEPNYLPFMAYRVSAPEPEGRVAALARRAARWLGLTAPASEELLVFCHRARSEFPLRVAIAAPEIGDEIADEFRPWSPGEYVAAVERALRIWERDLEETVRFQRVENQREAKLVVRIMGEQAPAPEPSLQVLGTTPLADSCRVLGGDPSSGRLEVRYHVPELKIYVADQHGLLLPDQVERIALHELGHAIGMRGHSPIPADLMYEVVRDRLGPDGLGAEDVNSFLSLYAIPSGTIYRSLSAPQQRSADVPSLVEGRPRLELAPHVDPRRGFEIQTPMGWLRIPTPFGVAAVNGVSWDYDASFQIIVRRYETIESYLDRNAAAHFGASVITAVRDVTVAGHRARRFMLTRAQFGLMEELTLIESGDGRVLISIAECPLESQSVYRPWFAAMLASLEIRDASRAASDRDYSSGPADPARSPEASP